MKKMMHIQPNVLKSGCIGKILICPTTTDTNGFHADLSRNILTFQTRSALVNSFDGV